MTAMTRRELFAVALAGLPPLPSQRKTVFIEMAGGPSQVETFDLEIGPWTPSWMRPVAVGDSLFPAGLMPRLAEIPERFRLVRGLRARSTQHHSIVPEGAGPRLIATTASFPEACRHSLDLLRQQDLVHICFGNWDHHGNIFERLRPMCGSFDAGVAWLIRQDVRIIAMGEFGRTPGRLNQNGGRDHYPVHAALVA
jgi:hypothetical protein